MPNRPAASSTSNPRKKRKLNEDQPTLHTFFGAKTTSTGSSTPISRFRGESVATNETMPSNPTASPYKASSPKPSSSADNTRCLQLPVEVIDVDLLDEEPELTAPVLALILPSAIPPFRTLVPSPKKPLDICIAAVPPVLASSYVDLSVDPLSFDIDNNPWPSNTPAPYSFLVHSLSTLSGTRSRKLILNTLTNTLRTLIRHHPAALLPTLYLLSNSLSPPYIPTELGLGPSTISKCIQNVSGLSSTALKKLYARTGDAGDVAFEAKSKVLTLIPHPPLLITLLYESLLKISRTKGPGAIRKKLQIVEKLLGSAKGEETRYLVRTLSQHIRVGAVRTSILTALARALVLTRPPGLDVNNTDPSSLYLQPMKRSVIERAATSPKKTMPADMEPDELLDVSRRAEALVKRVFVQHPNYDDLAKALLEGGLDRLSERVPLTLG
jgi:DNA ligase-1